MLGKLFHADSCEQAYPYGVGVADRLLFQTISFEIDYFTKDLSKDLCAALTEWNGCSVAYNFALL
jgi:hypothetical protein